MKSSRMVSVLVSLTLVVGSAVLPAAPTLSAPIAVAITQPTDSSTVAGDVSIKATVDTTPTSSALVVDGNVVATSTAYTDLGGGNYEVAYTWDSRSMANAARQLQVAATDEVATTATSPVVNVTVDNPEFTDPKANPKVFTPDKNGWTDTTSISTTFTTDATVTVQVKNPSGDVIATLASNQLVTGTPVKKAWTWTGLRDDKYPDYYNNWYTVEVIAERNGAVVTKIADTAIYTTKAWAKVWPSTRSFTPDGDGRGDRVLINTRLYKYSYMTVGIYTSSGKLVKTLRPWSLSYRRLYRYWWNGRWNSGRRAIPGLYIVKATTRNQAGVRVHKSWTRIRGTRWLLLVKDDIRLYLMEGREPAVGPRWADWRYGGVKAAVFPIAIGMPGWATPSGRTYIEAKRVWPTWYPPSWAGIGHPVGPGRSNPLGPRALNLSPRGYDTGIRIHGTNNPASIGTRASHGCIRMYPKDVIWMFPRVSIGTKVWVTQRHPRGYPRVGPRGPSPGRSRRWY